MSSKRSRRTLAMFARDSRPIGSPSSSTTFSSREWKRAALLLSFCVSQAHIKGTEASTGFPGTLASSQWRSTPSEPTSNPIEVFSNEASSSDDEEGDLGNSSSDFEDVGVASEDHVLHKDDDGDQGDNDHESEWTEEQNNFTVVQEVNEPEGEENQPKAQIPDPELASSSQPLQTLKKLQQMLDETDYMTASPSHRMEEGSLAEPPANSQDESSWIDTNAVQQAHQPLSPPPTPASESSHYNENSSPDQGKLWTSKDRVKYKKQQQRLRRAQEEQRRLEQQLRSPPLHPNSSDDDGEADGETDDGLGYTLPNLPVYFSDAEGGTDLTDVEQLPMHQSQQGQNAQSPPPPFAQGSHYQYPQSGYPPYPPQPDQMGQQSPPYMGYPPNAYLPYPPYGAYSQQQHQQMYASQYASAWAAAASAGTMPYAMARPPYSRTYPPPVLHSTQRRRPGAAQAASVPRHEGQSLPLHQDASHEVMPPYPIVSQQALSPADQLAPSHTAQSLAEASSQINFDSLQKLSILVICIGLLSYSAVSPRTLPLVDYNMKFYANLRVTSLAMIAPITNFLLVFDTRENDVNDTVNTFYTSFTVGYGLCFLLEVVLTTIIRLGVFLCWEPDVFKLTPNVPALVLPWVLRENEYKPKRITLFAADFATSCVAGPIIEEYVKLKILQLSVRLPRNFRWTTKKSLKNKRKRRVAELITRNGGEPEVTNVNSYVTQMLAASIGIKLCDSARRILMYTKDHHSNKGFYAICRGIFPIHELCGTMTALGLAKRDVLGVDMPLWKMLLPAVVIHGMANFRGMKPIFKWNSATPWSEMQLSPWNAADDSTLPQLLNKGFAKLMWLVLLGRVLGYCIKNYYLISRQAVKRTTTYSGKHAAFSAELAAAEMLKKTKEK